MNEPTPVLEVPVVEPPQPITLEGQPVEGTTETVTPIEGSIITITVEGEDKSYDIRDPQQLQELRDNAQKGIHYTRKMQGVAKMEEGNQQKAQMADMFLANPQALKVLFASQNGIDPAVIMSEPQAPPVELKETHPEYYYYLYNKYQGDVQQKAIGERSFNAFINQTTIVNNGALFEKTRNDNDLTDAEFSQVQSFVQMNIRPNPMGLYSAEQMNAAVNAVVGKDRQAKKQIQAGTQLNKAIKEAARVTTAIPQKVHSVSKEDQERDALSEYVRKKMAK
jgi:hypothetical protein